jgi:hypothetical protein
MSRLNATEEPSIFDLTQYNQAVQPYWKLKIYVRATESQKRYIKELER